jgi:peptide/nickel transport system permease protein
MSTVDSTSRGLPGARRRLGAHATRLQRGGWLGGDGSLRLGLGILGLLLLGSLVVSGAAVDPNHQNLAAALTPPGSGHPLGTDPLGRDVLSWIAGGIRIGLMISLAVVAIAAAVGTAVGAVAGYFGSWVDAALMRIVDLQLAVPPLILFLSVSAVLRPSILGLILLLSVVSWVPYARMVRTRIQSERTRSYVVAARLAGSGHVKIVVRHLFPSALSLVAVIGSLQAGYVLLWESALSFLGLGVQPPATSLGFMISAGKDQLSQAWWIVVFPGVTIVLLVFAFNLIGDGLRERVQIGESDLGVGR